MEPCTNCGDDFIPGSRYQTKCRKCLDLEIEEKTDLLRNINMMRVGNWNKSVATIKADCQQQSL